MAEDWAVSSYSNGFSPETKQNLHDLYSDRCAICGQKRESPFGRPEAEAAHIHPAQHGGPDRETNGLLLCLRCHWGFDSGWLSLRDDYSIIVADADSTHGYESFHQFSNRSSFSPAPVILNQRCASCRSTGSCSASILSTRGSHDDRGSTRQRDTTNRWTANRRRRKRRRRPTRQL